LKLTETDYYTTTAAKSMSEGDEGTEATITFDEDGNVVIDFGTTPGKLYYNSNNPRFLNYTSAQTKIQLYKQVAGSTPASINIYISEAGYATYASNFNLDFDTNDDVKAYIAKEISGDIKMVEVHKVEAGTGLLLHAPNGGGATFAVETTEAATDDVSDNLFKRGNDAAVATGTSPFNYILNVVDNKIGFYQANGMTVAKNRAYLQTTIAAARINLVFEDDQTTGISGERRVESGEFATAPAYNLQGQRVNANHKGLVIKNGKKVVIK
jgi:hypothetical protein